MKSKGNIFLFKMQNLTQIEIQRKLKSAKNLPHHKINKK